jgi:hypothetical protein
MEGEKKSIPPQLASNHLPESAGKPHILS